MVEKQPKGKPSEKGKTVIKLGDAFSGRDGHTPVSGEFLMTNEQAAQHKADVEAGIKPSAFVEGSHKNTSSK